MVIATQEQREACLKLLFVAEQELGVKEIPGPKANLRIMEYEKHTNRGYTGSDEEAWCAKFANYVADTAGFKGTRSAAARSFLKWGKKLVKPIPGCIVVFDRKDANNPNAAHVTFFKYEEKAHGTIACVGGNQGNMVKQSSYEVEKILGFRSPI